MNMAAKVVTSNYYDVMAQGVQSSSDILLHQVKSLGISVNEAVVPFLLCTGECIQVGAV